MQGKWVSQLLRELCAAVVAVVGGNERHTLPCNTREMREKKKSLLRRLVLDLLIH